MSPLSVLIVEDSTDDAELILRELRRGGYEPISEVVDTESEFLIALDRRTWDVVLCDHALPGFNSTIALQLLQERDLDVPFIIVSGFIGEDVAVEAMRAGASDYIMKDKLARLTPAVEREMREVEVRRERRQAQEALAATEAMFRILVEQALVGIYIMLPTGRFSYVNPKLAEIFGYTQEEIVSGKSVHDLVAEKHRHLVAENIRRRMQGEVKTVHYKLNGIRKDGAVIDIEVLGSRAELSRQPVIIGMVLDITERQRAEEERARLTSIIEATTDFVGIADANGLGIYVNAAGRRMLGIPVHENADEISIAESHPEGVREFVLNEAMPTAIRDGTWSGETVFLSRDGRETPVSQVIIAHKSEDGSLQFLSTVARDISERKETERALKESNRQLENALAQMKAAEHQMVQQERLQALGQMASGIAHDFNNALTPILGFSQLLLTNAEKLQDTEVVKQYLEMINLAARDAATVVGRLRAFYRPREASESFAPVGLNEVVGQAISLTQAKWKDQAQASDIAIYIETKLADIPLVLGNQAELRQALANLILNAVDAMPNGGKLILSTRQEQDQVILAVSDSGTGMTEEVRQHCLEPFFTTKGEQGTGMGLPAVYGTVQRHGGTLEIETEVGKGSTFIIRLPIMTAKMAENDLSEPAVSQVHILVVDDQPMVRQLISEYLLADGYTVEVATNGKDALEKFVAGKFDLVVTDRAMPVMNGDQLAIAIKKVSPSMPVILLTGVGDIMRDARERPEGVDAVLSKPINLDEIRYAISSCLTRKRGDKP